MVYTTVTNLDMDEWWVIESLPQSERRVRVRLVGVARLGELAAHNRGLKS